MYFKTIANSLLKKFGLRVTRLTPDYALPSINDYRALNYERQQPIIVELPIEKARWHAIPIPFDLRHPFVRASANAGSSLSVCKSKLKKELEIYYSLVKPKNFHEITGLRANSKLLEKDIYKDPFWPWDSSEKIGKGKLTPVMIDGKQKLRPTQQHGSPCWGPVSNEKLEVEAFRLSQIYHSILNHGYINDENDYKDGFVRGYVLENVYREWVWIPEQGQHRVSIASVFGIDSIKVKVTKIFREQDLDICWAVREGYYTIDEAKRAFSMYFSNNTEIPVIQPWLEYINSGQKK